MRYKTERTFDFSCEKVTKQLMDTVDGGYDMAELDDVTMWKTVKEVESPEKRIAIKEWCAHAQIPRTLQHVIAPRMLTWLEHSEWNRINNTYSFRIEPFYLKNVVSCQGRTTFRENGADKCVRQFDIELKVKIPVFGAIFEGLVVDYLKKNEEQDFKLSAKALEKAFGEKK